jgi:hypothetical protein
MKVELQRIERNFRFEPGLSERLPGKTRDPYLLSGQTNRTTIQEIVDLYSMLRDKSSRTAPHLSAGRH